MARKKTSRSGARKRPRTAGKGTAQRLRKTWQATLGAINSPETAAALKKLSARVERESKKAMKELAAGAKTLQTRLESERKGLKRTVDKTVKGALAAFNIPSREEIADLTRKVADLSRKIDSFKRR
jgi:hypothetical protein